MKGADIIATVRFYSTEEGGRHTTFTMEIFRGVLVFEKQSFSCGLHLDQIGPLFPGAKITAPITLLYPELIKPRLKIGSQFTLWEGKTIAEGIVEQILQT